MDVARSAPDYGLLTSATSGSERFIIQPRSQVELTLERGWLFYTVWLPLKLLSCLLGSQQVHFLVAGEVYPSFSS